MSGGWIGVDLDGTLAHYNGWKGIEHVGDPVPAMIDRVRCPLGESRSGWRKSAATSARGHSLIQYVVCTAVSVRTWDQCSSIAIAVPASGEALAARSSCTGAGVVGS